MKQRGLGRTDIQVSILGLGGEGVVEKKEEQERAQALIHEAIDRGVNYIDTSPLYGHGGSEENIGMVMAERRQEVFLASKTHDRTYHGTMQLFEESLHRLNTEYLDLYQIHNIRTDEDIKEAWGDHGAYKALEVLKEKGRIRYIGITGHKDPVPLLKGMAKGSFDCVLMSLNVADIHFRPFQKEVLSLAVQKNMGIIAMKALAVGKILQIPGIQEVSKALHYVWSFPVHTVITGLHQKQELQENVQAANAFNPLSDEEKRELEQASLAYSEEGNFFKHQW